MKKVRVGITVGDFNGIGPEVVIKTLDNPMILNRCIPVIYGSSKVISYHKNIVKPQEFRYQNLKDSQHLHEDEINVVHCWDDQVDIQLGNISEQAGRFAQVSLEAAITDLKQNKIDVLVTGPINKRAMYMAGFQYAGHTEYLTSKSQRKSSLMLMVSDTLRVGLVTNHIPLNAVAHNVTVEKIQEKVLILHDSLVRDFGIERPIIAILSLNPHAGDGGLFGEEEEAVIAPALLELKQEGMLIGGPFPADGFFGSGSHTKADGVLAMYHDQGLVPFKALSFGGGVNFTAGLDFIRTSPDHGTGYNIVGKNQADPNSFRRALFLAIDTYRNREIYERYHSNSLRKEEREKEDETEGADEDILQSEAEL